MFTTLKIPYKALHLFSSYLINVGWRGEWLRSFNFPLVNNFLGMTCVNGSATAVLSQLSSPFSSHCSDLAFISSSWTDPIWLILPDFLVEMLPASNLVVLCPLTVLKQGHGHFRLWSWDFPLPSIRLRPAVSTCILLLPCSHLQLKF